MLGQIKHKITINDSCEAFQDTITAAWEDYNNNAFDCERDIIALITGPLNASDENCVQWLLSVAKEAESIEHFSMILDTAKYGPSGARKKLEKIQDCLQIANLGQPISNNEVYKFLRSFYIFDYDLGEKHSVILSLLYSHISQFQISAEIMWEQICYFTQDKNVHLGIITKEKLQQEEFAKVFNKNIIKIPEHVSFQEKK